MTVAEDEQDHAEANEKHLDRPIEYQIVDGDELGQDEETRNARIVANGLHNLASAAHRIADLLAWQQRHELRNQGTRADLARAVDGLLYALKYSKKEGRSVAEAVEAAAQMIAAALPREEP